MRHIDGIHHDRWNRILNWLDSGGDDAVKFDLRWFNGRTRDCGTTACIGGYAGVLMKADGLVVLAESVKSAMRSEWLGMPLAHHDPLFTPDPADFGAGETYGTVDAAWAARVVRHYLDTGIVDWRSTRVLKLGTDQTPYKERWDQILTWLDAGGDDLVGKFDMSYFNMATNCGTTACIGGYANALIFAASVENVTAIDNENIADVAGVGRLRRKLFLNITDDEHTRLFTPVNDARRANYPRGVPYSQIDAPWAARVVRQFLTTGVINWSNVRYMHSNGKISAESEG